jgi:hypothetical protein
VLFLRWIIEQLVPRVVPEASIALALSPANVVATVLAGMLFVALAPLLTLRRLLTMDLPSTLRVVE